MLLAPATSISAPLFIIFEESFVRASVIFLNERPDRTNFGGKKFWRITKLT